MNKYNKTETDSGTSQWLPEGRKGVKMGNTDEGN